MNQRKRLIQETISVILSEVLDTAERRKDTLAKVNKELAKADKRTLELARQGYPDEHAYTKENDARYQRMKTLRDKIMARQGMNEDIRHPDLVRQEMDNHIEKRGWIPPHLHKELKDSMIAYGEMEPDKPRRKKRPQKGTENPTNEETLHELYGLAGLYARAIGNKRELSPEEQARGENPYLNPDGSTIYHTSPLAKALGGAEYVRLGSESVIKMTQRAKSLAGTTREMIKSILSGRVRGAKGKPMTPDQAVSIVRPRTQEVTRLVGTPEKPGKIGRRTERIGQVVQDTRDILDRLPQPKPQKPPEPPHYYG